MPKIQMSIKTVERSRIADPNVELYIAWFNTLKKVNLEYKDKIDKFEANTQFTKEVGNIFFAGHSTQMIKHHYVFCEFNHEPIQEDSSQQDGQTFLNRTRDRVPSLVLRNRQWGKVYQERLDTFSGNYHDLNYNMAYDDSSNDTFYLFSPDTLIRVYIPTNEHVIENLYIRKRYEDALRVLNQTYGRPMLDKIYQGFLN